MPLDLVKMLEEMRRVVRDAALEEAAKALEAKALELHDRAKTIPLGARSGRPIFHACPAYDVEMFMVRELQTHAAAIRAMKSKQP